MCNTQFQSASQAKRECVQEENTANRNHLWLSLDVGVAGNVWKAAIVNMPKS